MNTHVLIWDIESVADLPCVARVNGLDEADELGARSAIGDKFPKLPFHKVVCIGALIASRSNAGWEVQSLGAPHLGERTEGDLLQGFADKIDRLRPQLVTFNGASFDLPVLRYRAMINRVTAPGLECRRYWYRYSDDCLDLCDALSSYSASGKVSLNDLCRALGFTGKPDGFNGSEVERYVQDGRVAEVAAYCETDVGTYRVWFVYELFRGTITRAEFDASEANLLEFVNERLAAKPHLGHVLQSRRPNRTGFGSISMSTCSAWTTCRSPPSTLGSATRLRFLQEPDGCQRPIRIGSGPYQYRTDGKKGPLGSW